MPPQAPPPASPPYSYPAILQPGRVFLPPSESDILISLSKVLPSGAAQPVARSYDGHRWEGLAASPLPPAAAVNPTTFALASTYDRTNSSSPQLDACPSAELACEVLLPDEAPSFYRLDRYNATFPADALGTNGSGVILLPDGVTSCAAAGCTDIPTHEQCMSWARQQRIGTSYASPLTHATLQPGCTVYTLSGQVLFNSNASSTAEWSAVSFICTCPYTRKQLASRLLLQATFGPTRALLDGPLGSNMSVPAVRQWIGEQMSLPATSLRAYMRRATNPRIRLDLEGTLAGRTRPACSGGSRWHRFAFNSEDEDRVVRISSQGDGMTLVLSVEGEVRTELSLANYTLVTAGKCGVFTEYITTQAECVAAATSLGLTWRRNPGEARDDERDPGDTSRPRGCYMTASLGQSITPPGNTGEYLWTNVNDGNVATCSDVKFCICKRSLNASAIASQLAPPSSPSPPASPPALPGVTSPTQCDDSMCCVVIYEGARGAQCNPVPIWDFTSWVHPGGPFVQASALCGQVRYDWLAKDGNHGGDAQPEDLSKTSFAGGAVRVGTFVDPDCVTLPNATDGAGNASEYVICSVEEYVGGTVRMVQHDPALVLADNQHPCSGGFLGSDDDWYALANPAIALSAPEPTISQSFNASDVVLSSLTFGNGPSDAYLLQSAPSWCALSEQTSAYMRVGSSMWLRHDRRLEMTNCTGTCRLNGGAAHPYTLTNESFGGIDKRLGEVANEPAEGHRFNVWLYNEAGFRSYMPFWHNRNSAKMMAWTSTVISCADQLRHRVAFALSQIFVVGEAGLDKAEEYEVYTDYFDIFVRNAFGSYYDVLREVAYSPAMATYLSFDRNRAFASRGNLPDENFAREVMQLFTIGLYQLRDDGTVELDAEGAPTATYDNNDIMNFARVWTGFTRQPKRANIMRGKADYDNYVDPNTLMIDPHEGSSDRDLNPKIDLDDNYLGDGFPLCTDLPRRSFLRAGARYRRVFDAFAATEPDWLMLTNAPEIALGPNSSLAHVLCGGSQPADAPLYGTNVSSSSHQCAFADDVELPDDLPCDGAECLVLADAYLVQLTVGSPSSNLSFAYEFLRPPCVELTFHPGMERVRSSTTDEMDCADDTPETLAAISGHWDVVRGNWPFPRCQVTVLVNAAFGWVGFTGSPQWIPDTYHQRGGTNYFPVLWDGDAWPTPQSNCSVAGGNNGSSVCVVQGDVCCCGCGCYEGEHDWDCETVNVTTSAVFTNLSAVPTAAEVQAELSIGAPRPSDFNASEYSLCASAACSAAWPAVRVHLHANSSGELDERTIFEVEVRGEAAFFINKRSVLQMGDYTLRNPPHFMSFRTPLRRDAMYETEALLHHLMHHRNTPPFVAYRLIQRLVTSNPSPRYTKVVADAFRTSTYDGERYPGGYGSLAAAVHAILLDREARSPTLDLDPSHGQLREPLLRVMHVMRAMEYDSYDGRDPELHDLTQKLGQQVFQSPGVFNFYKPEYQAIGPIVAANVVAPEFEISTAPAILGFLNGATSLVRYGLTDCRGGFGQNSRLQPRTGGDTDRHCTSPATLSRWPSLDGQSVDEVTLKGAIDGSSSDGLLSFWPRGDASDAATVVSELDLLLTAGRLSDVSRRVIEDEYTRLVVNGTFLLADEDGTNCTHWGAETITTVEECEAAARAINKADDHTAEVASKNWKPVGCYYDGAAPEKLILNDNANPTKRSLCSATRDCLCKARGPHVALKRAIELMTLTPDFVATNRAQPSEAPRVSPPRPASGQRPYKALVVLFLEGGADSWNMIVPHSGCAGTGNATANYESYNFLRGGETEGVALRLDELLPIDVGPSQPCSTLGVHPRLAAVQRLYNAGDAAFLTNVGTLVEPMSKAEYLAKQKARPPSLFAHNVQQKVTQSMHPQDAVATGVMGRIADVLGRGGGGGSTAYRTGSYSLDGMPKMLEGERAPIVLDKGGVVSFEHHAELQDAIARITLSGGGNNSMNGSYGSYRSLFGETWAQQLHDALRASETLGAATAGVSLTASFPTDNLGQQMEQVARTVGARDNLQDERQLFFVKLGGFDTHASLKDQVDGHFASIDAALEAFEVELKAQGVWQDTVLLTASDFGRTYAPNGAGTDHAWGGNYFLAGGAVNGSRLLGQFPSSFVESGDVIISRNGRVIPTTPWESVWYALAEWLGVGASAMGEVLPNAANFPLSTMFHANATLV